MSSDRRNGSTNSIEKWLGRTLKLESQQWQKPKSVEIQEISGEDLVVKVKGDPPLFGEVIQLRAPGAKGAKVWLTGEIVALERIRQRGGGIRITVQLVEEAAEALAKLPVDAPHTDMLPPSPGQNEIDAYLREYTKGEASKPAEKPKEPSRAKKPHRRSRDDNAVIREDRVGPIHSRDEARRSRRRGHPQESSHDGIPTIREERLGPSRSQDDIPIIREERAPSRARDQRSALKEDLIPEDERVTPQQGVMRPNLDAEIDQDLLETPPLGVGQTPPTLADRKRSDSSGSDSSKKSSLGGYSLSPDEDPHWTPSDTKRRKEDRRGGRAQNWAKESSEEWPVDGFNEPSSSLQADMSDEWSVDASDEWSTGLSKELADRFAQTNSPSSDDSSKPLASSPEPVVINDAPPRKPTAAEIENVRAREEQLRNARQIGTRASSLRQGAPAVQRKRGAPIIGIDFGTTYSKIAVLDEDEVVLIEDETSYSSTRASIPSVIAKSSDGRFLVGERAREMLAVKPERVISSIKRVIGLSYSDPLANGLLGSLACPSLAGPNDSILFDLEGEHLTVPDIVSKILEYLLGLANKWTGTKIEKAVLTIPVDFDARARRELELAAKMIGLEIVAMVPEPVAAVMGVGFDGTDDATIAVYDFGGGTFDASIVEVGAKTFNVLGSAGDRWLGGDDLDELLARHTADIFAQEKGISLHNRQEEFQRLLFACEETKRLLSALEKVDVIMPNAGRTSDGEQVLLVPLAREDFNALAQDVVSSSIAICDMAVMEADRAPKSVDALLLTGGTSRVPVIRRGAESYFGKTGIAGIHPEHAVVIGAAIRAALDAGYPVPKDFARPLSGQSRPGHDIGIIQESGSIEPVIEASEAPPATAHRLLVLSRDRQTRVSLELSADGQPIGRFVIDDLPPRPAGEVTLNIYFELTTTGTLHVSAQDRETGQRAHASFDLAG